MAKTRIVLLDDHPAIAHATSTLLEMAGYKVECFHSVAELENVQYSNPDLYLLDRHLPFKGGLELCTVLKSDPLKSHIPVVIMSALRDTHILTRKAGGDAFLAKPFTRQDLISLVQLLTHNG
ncbi:MAG: response regulator [Chitinophagaceae bacterium]|nr:MAG: response regulator [Chitinophagaceae bacterium]